MPYEPETPFDSIEGAIEYVGLLVESVEEARADIAVELAEAQGEAGADRRARALQIVSYKLERLAEHTASSHRILNDLRTLRRLLLDERNQPVGPLVDADGGVETELDE
jgi:ubiquinone biosynthesis protein UbiJ